MTKAIALTIEVSETGLREGRVEIQALLTHASTLTPALAPMAEVWLRKLLREAERQARLHEREAQAEAERSKPKPPSIREMRGRVAA